MCFQCAAIGDTTWRSLDLRFELSVELKRGHRELSSSTQLRGSGAGRCVCVWLALTVHFDKAQALKGLAKSL